MKKFFDRKLNYFSIPSNAKLYTTLKSLIFTERQIINRQYKKFLGIYPDLDNPQKFTEKIQWLKLNDRNPLLTLCADKLKVRKFIEKKIGEEHLIPLLFSSPIPDEIPFGDLPSEYIIKTNHGSGTNIIVVGTEMVIDNKRMSFNKDKIKGILTAWLSMNTYDFNREWEYKDIKPMIIIEELLNDLSNKEILNDYKIHCFNGEPKYIQTIFDRNSSVKETWFDFDWEMLELSYFSPKKRRIEKPNKLDDMFNIAAILSSGFPYVRVDLYLVNDKIYFGELTFHPYSGLMKFKPDQWDFELGKLLKLPIDE